MLKLLKSKGRLRNKILTILFLVGVVPLVALGVVALISLNASHQLDVVSIENNLIGQKVEEIESSIENIVSTFQLTIGQDNIGELQIADQEFLSRQYLEEFKELEEVSFIDLAGQETSKFRRPFVASDDLFDQSKIDKFTIAKSGKNYIGPVYFTLKGPMITVSSPVLTKSGNIIQVLSGEVRLGELQKIVMKSKLGDTGYVYVVNKDNFLVAHSDPSKNTLSSLGSSEFIKNLSNNNPENAENIRYKSFWNEDVVASGKYLPALGLTLIAEWPVQDADRIVITVRNQIITISTIMLVITLLSSFLFANRIVGPIKKLERGTQLIADGKFDQPISIETGDEIEELGSSFNKMTEGLKRLEELKNEFIFIAAHELRTPVSVIKGYMSLILDGSFGPVSDPIKEVELKIESANQRLVQLVNDLLEIGRAEAGRLEIKVTPVDITESIETTINETKLLADKRKIEIIYENHANLPKVMADANRLKEIMTNLIGNAIKYNIDSGKIVVSHNIENGTLVTNVKDTGLGISKKDQEKLFEKFYRVRSEKTRDITGTGLGLFIVKQIVDKMGGKIWINSEEGAGSTFSFSLALA